jgi:hypothetical protein
MTPLVSFQGIGTGVDMGLYLWGRETMTNRREPIRKVPCTMQPISERLAYRPCATRRSCCLVALPIEFTAFCELRYEPFLRYARVHLDDLGCAEHAVRAGLGDLAITWPQVLRRPCPGEVAWHAVKQRIRDSVREQQKGTPRAKAVLGLIYRAVPEDQADAVVLRYLLDLTVDQAADLMGADPATVSYKLQAVQRRLGEDLEHRLRHCGTLSPDS